MPSISTTTLDVLEARMVTSIIGVVPRVTYDSGSVWKHYDKATSSASVSRRFTLRWVSGPYVEGGYFSPNAVDSSATLAVVTDYAGQHERLQHLVQDDWSQLRDVLQLLTADTTSGLIQIHQTRSPPSRVADSEQARARLSGASAANSDTFQVNLTYDVQFHQARG